jgi:hypothetical protein
MRLPPLITTAKSIKIKVRCRRSVLSPEERVKEFWGENVQPTGISWIWQGAEKRTHEAEFQQFIDTKLALLKQTNPEMKDREITEEEMTQAKDFFAKIKIYANEYHEKEKAGTNQPGIER